MNAEETEIFEFLKTRKANFVSVNEISKFLGRGRRYKEDRNWARPVLRRMEVDGIVEANPYGEYRLKGAQVETEAADFKEALRTPGASLGDTTIIRIQDA
ncbi:MAG TPA: hypothetical protein VJ063_14300 [Verrucomicrobiae bacterium]|nr:hypothetical protein [Verrucomicrobiae bacterium]